MLKSKYKIPPNPRIWTKTKSGSHSWSGIRDSKDIISETVKWMVGDGSFISLRHNWWCGKERFSSKLGNNSTLLEIIKVDTLINQRGEWDYPKISFFIPQNNIHDVTSTPSPC